MDLTQTLSLEKDQLIAYIQERSKFIDEYSLKLDSLIEKSKDYAAAAKHNIAAHDETLTQKKRELGALSEVHEKLKSDHETEIKNHADRIVRFTQSIEELESKRKAVNDSIQGLTVELANVEKKLTSTRGENSATERRKTELETACKDLEMQIEDNKNLYTKEKTEYESLQKSHASLEADIAILKNRK